MKLWFSQIDIVLYQKWPKLVFMETIIIFYASSGRTVWVPPFKPSPCHKRCPAVCPAGVAQVCSHKWARQWRQINCIAEGLLKAVCFPNQILFYLSVGNCFVLLNIFFTLSHRCWGSKDSSYAASMHNTSSNRQPASSYCLQTPALGQVISMPQNRQLCHDALALLQNEGAWLPATFIEAWFGLRSLFSAP